MVNPYFSTSYLQNFVHKGFVLFKLLYQQYSHIFITLLKFCEIVLNILLNVCWIIYSYESIGLFKNVI